MAPRPVVGRKEWSATGGEAGDKHVRVSTATVLLGVALAAVGFVMLMDWVKTYPQQGLDLVLAVRLVGHRTLWFGAALVLAEVGVGVAGWCLWRAMRDRASRAVRYVAALAVLFSLVGTATIFARAYREVEPSHVIEIVNVSGERLINVVIEGGGCTERVSSIAKKSSVTLGLDLDPGETGSIRFSGQAGEQLVERAFDRGPFWITLRVHADRRVIVQHVERRNVD